MGIILLRSFAVKDESQAYASAFPNELQIQFCSFFPVVEILGAFGNSFLLIRKAMRSWQVIRRLVFEFLGTLLQVNGIRVVDHVKQVRLRSWVVENLLQSTGKNKILVGVGRPLFEG